MENNQQIPNNIPPQNRQQVPNGFQQMPQMNIPQQQAVFNPGAYRQFPQQTAMQNNQIPNQNNNIALKENTKKVGLGSLILPIILFFIIGFGTYFVFNLNTDLQTEVLNPDPELRTLKIESE